jgi:RimJ/RimL family protein N-acetyltransferase
MTLLEHIPQTAPREDGLPILVSERLNLRAPRPEDAKAVVALLNDRRVAENTAHIPHPYRLADARDFIGRVNRTKGEVSFFITLGDGQLIGGCGINRRNGKAPEIGYWLGAPFWGQGFATEAARALIDHAFMDMKFDLLASGARVSNPASRRVLEKCGFQWTGVSLQRIRALASSAPVDRFRLDRGLWASLKRWGAATRMV